MRRVSIRELHISTGKLVREASHEPIVITERGHPIAVLKSAATAEIAGRPLPKRPLSSMPKVKADSTALISEEREAR
jgi:prevent-host-death family protein